MTNHTPSPKPRRPRRFAAFAITAALLMGAAGCNSSNSADEASSSGSEGVTQIAPAAAVSADISDFWDSSTTHDIEISFDEDEYEAIVAAYIDSGEKEWISATVTIDGTTYEDVGLRLKGNSSLRGITAETAEDPETLPWLIRLDKYIDDQSHDGLNDIVIRSNSTETALNEAVALELLEASGLASQQAVATSFSVNGGEAELRLAVENPDKVWYANNFSSDGLLYKADSQGDYSYRGDDAAAYEDVFDQDVGDDNLEPLTEFLKFINESDDETFAAELEEWLDVDSFATYLAFQDLIGNFDDIDGPGNNSYLSYDNETEQFTVVNWDLNLAFNTFNFGGGFGAEGAAEPGARRGPGGQGDLPPEAGAIPEGALPEGALPEGALPEGALPGPGAAGGNGVPPSRGNILSERFMSDESFAQMYTEATSALTESLFSSGTASEILDTWVSVLSSDALGLVDSATVEAEAEAIRSEFPT